MERDITVSVLGNVKHLARSSLWPVICQVRFRDITVSTDNVKHLACSSLWLVITLAVICKERHHRVNGQCKTPVSHLSLIHI